jgi:hypothetical protein
MFGALDTPEPEATTRFSQDSGAEEVAATAVNYHDHKATAQKILHFSRFLY